MEPVIVATDGSALMNPNGPGGWAWVVDKDRWRAGSVAKASNQVMEMYAILRALRDIPLHIPLVIQTDSNFCVNMVGKDGRSGWMAAWKRKGWIKADGKPPANLKLVRELDAALAARRATVRFEWVRGHNGHQLNTAADTLCTKASASQAKGKKFIGGPGWNSSGVTETPVTPSAPQKTTKSAVRKAPKKAVPSSRRKAPERIITSFDDGPDAMPVAPGVQKVKDNRKKCASCGGFINLFTGECRCSD